MLTVCAQKSPIGAQDARTQSGSANRPPERAAYLTRGDDTDTKYNAYRAELDIFFKRLDAQLIADAPDLRSLLVPPAPVRVGHQILPVLADPPPDQPRTRIIFSPFSWPRTDSVIARGRDSLAIATHLLDSAVALTSASKVSRLTKVIDLYRKLVAEQKFMASLVNYNRLWQGEIARFPVAYNQANILKKAAVQREALFDSIATRDSTFRAASIHRSDSLTRVLNTAMKKALNPSYILVDHPTIHRWIVTVPLYTDIVDSAFVEKAKSWLEESWHVQDGEDDFRVVLKVTRIPPMNLYRGGSYPLSGQINVGEHVRLFPVDGAVMTTGGTSTYALGKAMVLGPGTLTRATLVHEFSHLLGFRDNYFRSFEDAGPDGYRILEVILSPEDVLVVPENGKVRRGHFEEVVAPSR